MVAIVAVIYMTFKVSWNRNNQRCKRHIELFFNAFRANGNSHVSSETNIPITKQNRNKRENFSLTPLISTTTSALDLIITCSILYDTEMLCISGIIRCFYSKSETQFQFVNESVRWYIDDCFSRCFFLSFIFFFSHLVVEVRNFTVLCCKGKYL